MMAQETPSVYDEMLLLCLYVIAVSLYVQAEFHPPKSDQALDQVERYLREKDVLPAGNWREGAR